MFANIARFKKIILIGLFLLVPMLMLVSESKISQASQTFSGKFIDFSGFLQSGLIFLVGGIGDFFYHYVSSVNQAELIHKYRAEAAQANSLKNMLYEVSLENQKLKGLFNSVDEAGLTDFTVARVTGRKGAPLSRIIHINRGAKQGISRGDAVINNYGVVGQVVSVGNYSSEVLLATDSSSAIDVLVQTSRARGILRGSSDSALYEFEVRDFDHLYAVHKGETIVSSGLGAKFPVGVPVGEVVSISRERDGVYLVAKIKPFVDFARLEHVLIVKNSEHSRRASLGDLIRYVSTSSEPLL